jgi:hypothetical protein
MPPANFERGTAISCPLFPVLVPRGEGVDIEHPLCVAEYQDVPVGHDAPLKFSVFALAVTCDPVTNGAEKYRAIVPLEVAWAAGLTEPIAKMADTRATAVIFLLEVFM